MENVAFAFLSLESYNMFIMLNSHYSQQEKISIHGTRLHTDFID